MSTGIAAPEKPASTESLLLEAGPAVESQWPGWFRQAQKAAWREFERQPMPVRTDEPWRFASIKKLDLAGYRAPRGVSEDKAGELVERSRGLDQTAGRMVFANDQWLTTDSVSDELSEKGVIWAPLEKAITEHAEIFQKYFMTQDAVLGSAKFAALHKAMVSSGTFLYVPKGVELELPLEVFHWLHGEGSSTFPHTLLVAEAMSKVTLVDYFHSANREEAGFACGVNDLILGDGAQLTHVCVQDWSERALALQINSTVVGRDAHAKAMTLNLGSNYARHESVSRLAGPGGRSDMLAVTVADGEREFDQRTLQDHQQPDTGSDLLYKNALFDAARTIFAGLIRVEPHAHRTDAYQKVRNLLLSDEAEANSMPGLEIMADQVKCSHGATSGQIDEEELFYMLARGLREKDAKRLIVAGFLGEAIDRLEDEAICGHLRELVVQRFARSTGIGSGQPV